MQNVASNNFNENSCPSHFVKQDRKNSALIVMTFLWCTLMNCITLKLLLMPCSWSKHITKKRDEDSQRTNEPNQTNTKRTGNYFPSLFFCVLHIFLLCSTVMYMLKCLLIILYRKQGKIETKEKHFKQLCTYIDVIVFH